MNRRRGLVTLGAVLAGILLTASPCAFALNPALDVSQYSHKAWTVREGFFKGVIYSIAQTPDGYLWLGTEFGLLRFDGVRAVPWQPPPDQHLPSTLILQLLAARDGTLWIGTSKGLASWKGGKLTQYAELAGRLIPSLLEDREGSVWAGTFGVPSGRLCAIRNGSVRCYGEDGSFGVGVFSLYEHRGNLWAGAATGLWRWKPDPPKLYPMTGPSHGIPALIDGDNGALWIARPGGIRQLVDGKDEVYPLPAAGQFNPTSLLRDREGGLWIGTGQGLVHVHQGRTDVFASVDGLSGDGITSLFEDREGNIWAATRDGLDRFRDFAVTTLSFKQGLSGGFVGSVLTASDGSVWLGTGQGLDRWNNGQITIYRKRNGRLPARAAQQPPVREIYDDGLPDNSIESLFEDDRGRIWVSTLHGNALLENGRFIPVGSAPTRVVRSIAEESAGNLWINDQDHGLYHLVGGRLVEQIPWTRLGHEDFASALVLDRARGGLWLGFFQGGVAYFKDGRIRASYAAAGGLGEGKVNDFRLDPDGTLWAATEGGLSRLKDGRVATLTSKNGLPCDGVYGVMEDDAHSFWLYMSCGLARVARSELVAWAADPNHTIQAAVFDSSDGIRSRATGPSGFSPQVAKSPDGKLWFATDAGVSVVDPHHLPFNKLPPPVHIEQVIADRKTYAADGTLPLPALVRDVEIDYTALSYVAPEKVRFRYKLEGHDSDWQDAGNRRQAFYTNLPPRNYRFRVAACNNSSVWNEAGAFLDFSVAPAYYQTTWFRLSCAAAFLALLAGLYQLRLRQVAQRFNVRMEERVNERTRIARDLHDTLLQSFQGVLMKFSAVSYLIPERPDAQKTLEGVIAQARQAITEGRDAVQGLRSSTVITNDLARAITTLGNELAAEQTTDNPPDFRVHVEGASRDLAPLVRDEVYRIASEALRNAFRHAQAGRIEVEIRYDPRQLRLRVRDDGKGIDPKVLEGGRTGHHGLPGMHERAKLVGGKLAVWSELDSGTEAELVIPAALAYAKPPAAQSAMSSGSGP
jgi:signal transduction histidine kinase/ligand-binding sensor domain-containing protein